MKISIITVSYNSAKTIEQTIKSVISQSHREVEYIIIDGGSTDGTIEIIEKYSKNIDFWVSEPDEGIYAAMNKGVKKATGDIVAFLNSDDWYVETALEIVNSYFFKDDIDILMGWANMIANDEVVALRKINIESIFYSTPCCHQACFAKKSVFDEIGEFDLKYVICADHDWMLRAYNAGTKIKCVNDIFVNYRLGGESGKRIEKGAKEHKEIAYTNAICSGRQELIPLIEEQYEQKMKNYEIDSLLEQELENDKDKLKQILGLKDSYYIWGTGYYGWKCYELFKKADINIVAFVDNSKKKKELYGYPVISPDMISQTVNVCVATPKYEMEIVLQMEGIGIAPERYTTFTLMREKILRYTEDDIKENL